jgi:4-hydroxybenzoate polyprenyltransferase
MILGALASRSLLFLQLTRGHITLVATLGVLTFQIAFFGFYDWRVAAICCFDWFLVNLINRFVDNAEDVENGVVKHSFSRSTAKIGAAAAILIGVASLAVLYPLAPRLLPWRIAAWLLSIAYNFKVFGLRNRLKETYFWKNIASAGGFMLTVFAYPIAQHAPQLQGPSAFSQVIFVGLFFFVFELSFELAYDLRDVAGDKRRGIVTIPVAHGEAFTRRAIYALLGLSIAIMSIGLATGLPWRIAVMFFAPALSALYLFTRTTPIRERDCIVLTTLSAALLCGYNLWVCYKLPFS